MIMIRVITSTPPPPPSPLASQSSINFQPMGIFGFRFC